MVIIASGWSQVNISGTVEDSRTGDPVVAAKVSLPKMSLEATTGIDGKFTLSGTPVLHGAEGSINRTPLVEPGHLRFFHTTGGAVRVSIVDLSGSLKAVIFSGKLSSGIWQISPPQLPPGMYICTFDTPLLQQSVCFLSSIRSRSGGQSSLRNISSQSDSYQSGGAKRSAASSPVDTLIISKNGYRTLQLPIDSYSKADLTILLEDTATTTVNLDETTIIPDPSWTCFMPGGIPPPKKGVPVLSITMELSAIHKVGLTRFGMRYQYDIKGGTVTGDKIKATLLSGGLDYELTLSNGSVEVEQINILKTSDNTPILMRNAGVAPAGGEDARVVLDFEAPNSSSYTWLNSGTFAATRVVDTTAKTIKLDVYDISKVSAGEPRVTIKDPPDAENQTWECVKISGSQGATVFTESVSLGSSVSIGASKRGSRNIIPITGGTTTGKVTGKILNGGADYQLGGLDARYTLAPDDGEFIIVRNCGSGGLIPVFEARVAGPYNFLNENKYLSSQPGMSGGGVSITFYEKR